MLRASPSLFLLFFPKTRRLHRRSLRPPASTPAVRRPRPRIRFRIRRRRPCRPLPVRPLRRQDHSRIQDSWAWRPPLFHGISCCRMTVPRGTTPLVLETKPAPGQVAESRTWNRSSRGGANAMKISQTVLLCGLALAAACCGAQPDYLLHATPVQPGGARPGHCARPYVHSARAHRTDDSNAGWFRHAQHTHQHGDGSAAGPGDQRRGGLDFRAVRGDFAPVRRLPRGQTRYVYGRPGQRRTMGAAASRGPRALRTSTPFCADATRSRPSACTW